MSSTKVKEVSKGERTSKIKLKMTPRRVFLVVLVLFSTNVSGQPRNDQLRIFDEPDEEGPSIPGPAGGYGGARLGPRGGRKAIESDRASIAKLRKLIVQMKWRSASEAAAMSDTDVHNTAIAEVYRDSDTDIQTLQQLPLDHVVAKAQFKLNMYLIAHADDAAAAAEEADSAAEAKRSVLDHFRTVAAGLHWRSETDAAQLTIDEARNVAIIELAGKHALPVGDLQQASNADLVRMAQRDLDSEGGGSGAQGQAQRSATSKKQKRLAREQRLQQAAERRKEGRRGRAKRAQSPPQQTDGKTARQAAAAAAQGRARNGRGVASPRVTRAAAEARAREPPM